MTSDLPGGARVKAQWRDIERPDWVIVGGPMPDGSGVALLASRTLTSARLSALATDMAFLEQMTAAWMRTGVFLGLDVRMDDFVVAWGATYPEALESLFERWVPPHFQPARRAVEAEVRELPAGPSANEPRSILPDALDRPNG